MGKQEQMWRMEFQEEFYDLSVTGLKLLNAEGVDNDRFAMLDFHTTLIIHSNTESTLKIKGARNPINFDYSDLGVGGLDEQFKEIFQRAFLTRQFPQDVLERIGSRHVRGMLMYGPPGCGKTAVARSIGKMLNGQEPKVVNGPELKSKYVGQGAQNIKELFVDAEKDLAAYGDEAPLHVIIFDEIDAICKKRGGGNEAGSKADDDIVNQLLTKID